MAANLDNIEIEEQDLIHQIRTSGVRKARETELVNKILDIRRERRSAFAVISAQLVEAASNFKRLEQSQECKSLEQESILEKNRQLKQALLDKEDELASIRNKMEAEFETRFDLQRKNYKSKLQLLGDKMNELQRANLESRGGRQEEIEAITARLCIEFRAQYSNKSQRYKEALRDLVNKQSQVEAQLKEQMNSLKTAQQYNSALELQNSALDELIHKLRREIASNTSNIESLQIEKRKMHGDIKLLEGANAEHESHHQQTITDNQHKHAKELAFIDAKVRQAMQAKDEQLRVMTGRLQEAEAQLRLHQLSLQELNSGISVKEGNRSATGGDIRRSSRIGGLAHNR